MMVLQENRWIFLSILSLVLLIRVLALIPEPFIYRVRACSFNRGISSGYRFNTMAREAMTPKALVTGVVPADEAKD